MSSGTDLEETGCLRLQRVVVLHGKLAWNIVAYTTISLYNLAFSYWLSQTLNSALPSHSHTLRVTVQSFFKWKLTTSCQQNNRKLVFNLVNCVQTLFHFDIHYTNHGISRSRPNVDVKKEDLRKWKTLMSFWRSKSGLKPSNFLYLQKRLS